MDNHHVNLSSSSASCGVMEASGITSDSKKVLYAIATRLYHPARGQPTAFLMWSDLSTKESNGGMLFQTIEKLFGDFAGLQSSHVVENPLTGNDIQVFLWVIPHERFRKWYGEERVKKAKEIR